MWGTGRSKPGFKPGIGRTDYYIPRDLEAQNLDRKSRHPAFETGIPIKKRLTRKGQPFLFWLRVDRFNKRSSFDRLIV